MNNKIRRYFFEKNESKNQSDNPLFGDFETFFHSYQGKNKGLLNYLPDNVMLNIILLFTMKMFSLFCVLFVSFSSISCVMEPDDTFKLPAPINNAKTAQCDTSCSIINLENNLTNVQLNQTANDRTLFRNNNSSNSVYWMTIIPILVFLGLILCIHKYYHNKYVELDKKNKEMDNKDFILSLLKISKDTPNARPDFQKAFEEELLKLLKNLNPKP